MRKIEILLVVVSLLGIFMLGFQFPFGGILTILGLSFLMMFYMGFSFALFNNVGFRNIFKKEAYKESNVKRIIGAIGTGLALSTTLSGALFTLMFWPGAKMNLLNGIGTGVIIFIVALFFYLRTKSNYYVNVFKRLIVVLAIGLILYFAPRESIVKFRYGNDPELVQLIINSMDDPQNPDVQKQLDEYWKNHEPY